MLHKLSFLVLLFLIPFAATYGQYTTGRLDGTIHDPTGAVVVGADVRLANLETGASRALITAADGFYFFSAVPPGTYRVTVTKPGFRTSSADIAIYTSQTARQNFDLVLGEQPITINVVEEAASELQLSEPLRQVTRGTLEVETLPNSGRNVVNLITLSPGVTPTFNPRGGNLTTLSIAQAGQMNANGGRAKASSHQLDYTDANDWEFGGIALATQPTPDMLEEFKILANNWSAEYGVKASAEVLMITKSGTNAIHGSAYDFFQNAALNARDYFDQSGLATPLRQNFYGFTAGGPVRKDRTFLFGGYEGRRTRGAGSTVIANVPTQSARDRVTDPNIQAIVKLLPLPTAAASGADVGTLAVLAASPSNSDQFLLRGDHYFTGKNSLAVRYFQSVGTGYSRTAGSLPGFDATFDPVGRNAMIADTWVLSPTATNELRLSYGRSSALFTPETLPATPRYSVSGLVGFGTVQSWPQGRVFNVYQLSDTFGLVKGRHVLKAGFDLRRIQDNSINDSSRRGVFTFASVNTFLAGTPSAWSQVFGNTYRGFRTDYNGAFLQDDWKVTSTLTVNLGLRWEYQGGLREANQLQSVLDPSRPGTIGQAGTGLLGTFRTSSPLVGSNPALVAPRFGFAWNPGGKNLVVRGGYGVYYDSFLFNSLQAGRTTPPSNYTGSLAGSQIAGSNSLANLLAGTAAIQQSLNGQVGGFGSLTNLGSIVTTKPDLRNPYVQQFSFGVQYRLTSSLTSDVAYVGTRGTALTTYGPFNSVAPGNRPAAATSLADEQARLASFQAAVARENGAGNSRLDARFNDVSFVSDSGSSTYHSLQAQLTKSYSHGLMVRAYYTWSKSIDNSSDYSPGQATTDRNFAQDQFNVRNERAVSTFDIPHRFTLSHVWLIPAFRDQKGLAGQVLGGWTFASINQMQSGIPYTVLSGPRLGISDVNMDGNLVSSLDNARASCVAGGAGFTLGTASTIPAPAKRGVDNNANSANFKYVQPLLGNNGTCGRNTERMAHLVNFDWTLSKKFQLFERGVLGSGPWAVEYRADFFNVFNNPFLTASGDDFRNVSSANFGLFNAAGASRRVQMALRMTW